MTDFIENTKENGNASPYLLKNHVSPVRSRPSAQAALIGESANRARTDHPIPTPQTMRLASVAKRLAVSLYALAADSAREGLAGVADELRARAFRLDSWASDRSAAARTQRALEVNE